MGAALSPQVQTIRRRLKVAELMLRDVAPAEIGRRLGITRQLAAKDCSRILSKWNKNLREKAQIVRAKECAKLTEYERLLRVGFDAYTDAGKYELAARVYDRIHKVAELRSELEALRQPDVHTMSQNNMQIVFKPYEYEGKPKPNAATTENAVLANREAD